MMLKNIQAPCKVFFTLKLTRISEEELCMKLNVHVVRYAMSDKLLLLT